MADIFQIKKDLLQIIHDKLIPWAHGSGVHSCILARQPLRVPPGVSVSSRSAVPLVKTGEGRSYFCLTEWTDAKLEALRFPYLGCVIEGEADLIVGSQVREAVTSKRGRPRKKTHSKVENDQKIVLSCPSSIFIIYPPGIPHETGGKLHWERPHPERAHAKIFWMNVMPAGIICHTCATARGEHVAENYLFLHDPHFLPLINDLMEELAGCHARYELIAQSYLLAMLGRLERGISVGTVLPVNEVLHLNDANGEKNSDADNLLVLQRACQYIQSHLHEPLSPESIARHAYISAPYLMRLFRLKKGTTVMKYVGQCRIEYAKSLLKDTDLPVSEISKLAGYRRLQHFSHVFSVTVAVSPLEFRRKISR
jgi:AraC-like DNA-binding protein